MAFVYINNKTGKLHQSVFLVFSGGQEQFNMPLNTCRPRTPLVTEKRAGIDACLFSCSTSSIQTYLGLMAA